MDWYYLSEHHERIPVPDSRLRSLALGGVLRPTTMLWRKGMSTWQTCGEVRPEIFAPRTPAEEALPSDDDRSPAAQLALQRIGEGVKPYLPWITAFGWFVIIPAALTALIAAALIVITLVNLAWLKVRAVDLGMNPDFGTMLGANSAAVVGAQAIVLIVSFAAIWAGVQLVSARRRLERSWIHGSVQELQRALAALGRYCTGMVLLLIFYLVLVLGGMVWKYWPEKEKKAEEPAPAAPAKPERVTI